MKGRSCFTRAEADAIRRLLREKKTADRNRQKTLRSKIRNIGFYISDFATDQAGFTDIDFDRLVKSGAVTIEDGPLPERSQRSRDAHRPMSGPSLAPRRGSSSGHRVTEKWIGESIDTLEDLLRPGLRAVCVGINPALTSVEAGHYYQGAVGQRFFSRLRLAGLLPVGEAWEDDLAFGNGIGFTDIVKRPSKAGSDVSADEFEHGRSLLLAKLEDVLPELVLFVFRPPAEKLLGPFTGNGFLEGAEIGGAEVFLMPGPYARREAVSQRLKELERWWSGTGTPRRPSSTGRTFATCPKPSLQRSPWFTARSSAR